MIDLRERGLYNYATHPSTQPILLGWCFGEEPVQIWECLRHPLPDRLHEAFLDPNQHFAAWRSSFERWILTCCLGFETRIDQWTDPSVLAKYSSIPGSLEEAGKIIGLPEEKRKIGEGTSLIQFFSIPAHVGGEETLFGIRPPEFRDWDTNPDDWERFKKYCIRDVECERYILHALRGFKLPEREVRGWHIDQLVNDVGMPCDTELCANALKIAVKEKEDLLSLIASKTGLANPNSNTQILAWIKQRGYAFESLGKLLVDRALSGECELTPECREILLLRKKSSKTSYTKFQNILTKVGNDGRLRDQFSYLGASRTGRWSSVGLNLQNMPRPSKYISTNIELAVNLLREGQFEEIQKHFPDTMELASGCIRSAFRAPEGKKLVVCDLSAIENRILGYLSGCDAILDVFRKGLDPYIDFAMKMYKIPYDQVTKDQRQMSKPAVLGAGFMLGGGDDIIDRYGNPGRSGLYGYASQLGVDIPKEQCKEIIGIYRKAYPEVVSMWYGLNDAAMDTIRDGHTREWRDLVMQAHGGTDFLDRKVLRMGLPAGRNLFYIRPRIEKKEFFNKLKDTVTFEGLDQISRLWQRTQGRPGKWTENAVQSVARDVLLEGLFRAVEMKFEVVGTCHDEIITVVDEDSSIGIKELRECMIAPIDWAPGLPLDASGYESKFYRKD